MRYGSVRYILSIFFLYLFFVFYADNTYACAYWESYEYDAQYDVSFFEYSIINQPLFINLYPIPRNLGFTPQVLEGIEADLKKNANLKEWYLYFEKKGTLKELEGIIYSPSVNVIDNFHLLKEDKEALEYIKYAKEVAAVADARWYYDWDKEKRSNKGKMEEFFKKAVLMIDQAKKDFFKGRYSFQAVRLAALLDEHKKCLDLFDKYITKHAKKSMLYYWALGYKARALLLLNQKTKAIQMYLTMFDQSPVFMTIAKRSLEWIRPTDSEWRDCLKSMESKHKQGVLWMVRDFVNNRADDLEPLKKLLEVRPKSAHPEIVLMNKILNLERYYLNVGPDKTDKRIQVPAKLARFCEETAKNTEVRNKNYWLIASAYLNYLANDMKKADLLIRQADNKSAGDTALKNQIDLIRVLITFANEGKGLSDEVQKSFGESLKWAAALKTSENNKLIYSTICRLLGKRYQEMNDIGRASIAFYNAKFSETGYKLLNEDASDKDLEGLSDILVRKPKVLDKILLWKFPHSREDILFIRGRRFLCKQEYDQAYVIFKEIPGHYWSSKEGQHVFISTKEPANFLNIQKGNVKYYANHNGYYNDHRSLFVKVNLMEFSKVMKDLKEKAGSSDKANFTMGNIYATMPDPEGLFPGTGSWDLALKYYRLVMDNSLDKELSSKSLIMYTLIAKRLKERNYDDTKFLKHLEYIRTKIPLVKESAYYKSYSSYCPDLQSFE
ncbi:MAG: hypothetical protein KKH98_11670 [Spirochaetes bacterium]|nr:hypothetical protein [Spirochaetota bacterium]